MKTVSRLKKPHKSPDGTITMLTDKQKQFVDNTLEAKTSSELITRTQAAHETDRETARQIVFDNLRKPNILQHLYANDVKAQSKIVELIDSGKDEIALRASQDVLDRVHGKATQQIETKNTSVSISIDLTGTNEQLTG